MFVEKKKISILYDMADIGAYDRTKLLKMILL